MIGNKMDAPIGGGVEPEKSKTTMARRSWTRIEEDALIRCLLDIVSNGWKADNGFKAGFQRELEKGMRKLLPRTDIVATPHINSKIHVWKKDYTVLSDLLSKSGIGWNSSTNTQDIIDEAVWDQQKMGDPHVKTMRFKSWPYYSQWTDIFGKDRTTGEGAVDPTNMVNELIEETGEEEGDIADKVHKTGVEGDEMDQDTSVCKVSASGSKVSKGKKRKTYQDNELSSFAQTLGDYMKDSNECFNTLAVRMGTEYDSKITRANLNEIMKNIPGLSLHNKLKVSDELVQNTQRLEYFMSLPVDEHIEYVWMLLDGRI
ncbi:hypothetical protein ACS0TY_021377 [Phlomoides rotata]